LSETSFALKMNVRCHELVAPLTALERDATLGFATASEPGAAVALAGGARILHFAPGRWLITEDALEREAERIARLVGAGATIIDGRAKWCRIELTGGAPRQVLSGLLPVEQVLGSRGCAAASLLECPGVLAANGAALEFWVGRSWASWLHETLAAWLKRRAALSCGA
jgi:sarcosine oxidase gamma subunit